MMRHVQDKVFLTMEPEVSILLAPGINTLVTTGVRKSRKPIECRYTDPYICRILRKECTLKIKLSLNNGFMSMQECSSEVGQKYFPLYTYFHLGDYVRVLPPRPGDNAVRLRYYNGFTPDDFRYVLSVNKELYHTHNMKEVTRRWMSSFGQ